MKIIHTSDLHLDSPLTSHLSPLAARKRKRELTESLRRITEAAEGAGAEAVIIAGDLFDSDEVSQRTLDMIMGIIENASNICFFYLSGNHERDVLIASGIRIPKNLKIFGEDWTYFQLGDVTLAGRSRLSEDMLSTLSLDGNGKNIVVLHGALADRCDGDEKIGVRDMARLPIDYLALGHYHSYSATRLGERGIAVYCGAPEGRGFDEAGDKGYVIFDTCAGFTPRFVPSSIRRVRIATVDVTGAEREIEVENRVLHAAASIPAEDVVRIVLSGEYTRLVRCDVRALQARLEGKFFYLEIKDEARLAIRAEDYAGDKSLKGEFIRLVYSKPDISDEEKEAIIECGLRALAGESV